MHVRLEPTPQERRLVLAFEKASKRLCIAVGTLALLGLAFHYGVGGDRLRAALELTELEGVSLLVAAACVMVLPGAGGGPLLRRFGQLGAAALAALALFASKELPAVETEGLLGVSAALLLLGRASERAVRLAHILALTVLLGAVLSLYSYLYIVNRSFGISAHLRMDPLPSLGLVALAVALLFRRADRGLMRALTADSAGGAMARRLYPAMVGLPLVLGWVILVGERARLYNAKFGLSLLVLTSIAAFVVIISLTSRSLDRLERDRLRLSAVLLEEAERRHLARELHDEIGQSLTGLKLRLSVLSKGKLEGGDEGGAPLRDAQVLLEEIMGQVSNLSLDLRPPMLDDLGLLPALLWMTERFGKRSGVEVAFSHGGIERRFPAEIETAIYRIVQEALTNVARHSGTQAATVRATADGMALSVQIVDRGRGFDPEVAQANRERGGLLGMRERCLLLGGVLTVESSAEQGTCITAELPLGGSS